MSVNAENTVSKENIGSRVPISTPPYIAHISFSFAIGIIFLIEILLLVCLSSMGFLGLQEYYNKMESSFYQRGKGISLSMSAASSLSMKKDNYETLINIFGRLATKDDPVPREKAISEVFLLSRNGVILAHNDITLITKNSEDPLSTISLKYNNEFFHRALLIDEGQIISQKFPYSTTAIREKASYLIQALLPEKIDYSMDFSTPVYKKGKPVATMHIIMNRMFMYQFLVDLLHKYAIIVGIVMAAGLLISIILLLAFVSRARYLHRIWQNILKYKIENDMVKHEIHHIEEKVDKLDRKGLAGPILDTPGREQDVKDAILLE